MTTARPRRSDREHLVKLYAAYLRPYWRSCLLLMFGYLLVSLLTAMQPLVMAPILEAVLGRGSVSPDVAAGAGLDLNTVGRGIIDWLGMDGWSPWRVVVVMGLLYFGVLALRSLLVFGNYMLALWIRVRSSRDMQQSLFQHILSLSLDFFHRRRTGELISRLDKDTLATISGLEPIVSGLVISTFLIIIYGQLLVRTNPQLTVLVVIAGALHYVLTQTIRHRIRRRVRDQFNVMADLTSYLQEVVSAVRVVKSFAAERFEALRLRGAVGRLLGVNLRYGIYKHVQEPAGLVINGAINVAILLLATHELFAGRLTTSGFLLYLYVGRAIVEPISSIATTYTLLQQTLASGERVADLFEERPLVRDGAGKLDRFTSEIRFEKVSFAYEGEPVLRAIELTVRQGEIVALVGPSGAGKSTLTDLTLRFYDPQAGRITIDGCDLRDLELASYRRLFGVVSQESLLFNASIGENIAYASEGVNQAEVEHAARIANAHQFILELPEGYDTVIGDRGVRLSGGQRQRVAIARAVVRRPQILILDEATSALDSESERLVQDAINRVIEGTTAIVVAHRLSTVLHADTIVVLDRGAIVDQGRHRELLARCDLYRRLCEIQFGLDERGSQSLRPSPPQLLPQFAGLDQAEAAVEPDSL